MNYDPNKNYIFTDAEGNTFTSKGDNGYVWQSMTEGVPISVDSNGEWYIVPKLTTDGKTVTAHIPSWFKTTDEYNIWKTNAPQFVTQSMTQDTYDQLKDTLTKLGKQGLLRVSLTQDLVDTYHVTDPVLQNKYFENILQMGIEGAGGEPAKLNGIFGSDQNESVADFARSMKDMSKEDLSQTMQWLYNIAEQGANGTYEGDQEKLVDAVTVIKMLNYVDDNYSQFGKDNEFQGLLEASFWQKLRTANDSMLQTMAENFPLINLLARGVYGLGQVAAGEQFSLKIEDGREMVVNSYLDGGGLEGRDAAMSVGNVIGTVGNIAGTMVLSVALGNVIGGTAAAATPGSFVAKMGMFAKTIPGAAVTDFFLNDIPIDLTFMVTDWARTGDFGKAIYNPEEEQPLFGIPVIGHFGPKAPGGLAMNALGDAIIDCALPILAIMGNTSFKKLDEWTNGGVTRFREKVQMDNLKLQQKLTDIPVFGTGWKKFMNYMMGPEHASFVREARKAAIAEGSMAPYVRAQNLLTLANHSGMTDIAPLYKILDDELEISKSVKNFASDTEKYGKAGKTSVEWDTIDGGVTKHFSKTLEDTLPLKVKQGLLDIERLSELKGQLAAGGGIISDPGMMEEIAKLEKEVAKIPKEIADFADRFSQLNKGVEMIGVKLGVSNEEWVNALQQNPMWEKYMTRQALVPGGGSITPTGGAVDPTNAAILEAARKGYYAENYIDPLQALWLKTEALGRAYAWNERAKALVSFEVAQGKIKAGKGGVETAKRLAEIKSEIKTKTDFRAKIGYDTAVSTLGKDVDVVSSAFKRIDDLQNLPERISLKGLYDSRKSPKIREMVDDFETGKIQFAEGVKESAGLTDAQGADVVMNTYAYKGMEFKKKGPNSGTSVFNENEMLEPFDFASLNRSGDTLQGNAEGGSVEVSTYDNATKKAETFGIDYNAGMTADGRAFKYNLEDGKITSMEEIQDAEGMAAALSNVDGSFSIHPETIERIGMENAQGIGRTILFYRDNIPDIGLVSDFKVAHDDWNYGFVPWPNQSNGSNPYGISIKDGKIEIDSCPVYVCEPAYAKGREKQLLDGKKDEVASGRKPRNTATLESTPTHENGHSLINRLGILELNRKIDEGVHPALTNVDEAAFEAAKVIEELEESVFKDALESLGLPYNPTVLAEQAATISDYASRPVRNMTNPYGPNTSFSEIPSEGMRMYQGNGDNSSPFCLAVVEQIKKRAERYTVAAVPGDIMKRNGLQAPKGLINKKGEYNFPANTKSSKAKSKWLDEWRQKNPYAKGKGLMTEDEYTKANLWDTYFQKEIRAYDASSKSSMPELLAKRNGDFLEDLAKTSAKKMVQEIEAASVKGFSQELATMVLSRNSSDISDAMNSFIIQRVNQSAREIAKKMPGGITTENLNKARATLWSEDIVKNDFYTMVSNLSPDIDAGTIRSMINELFDTQAKGFANADALPIETKQLFDQKEKFQSQLSKDNSYAKKVGKETDEALKGKYVGDATQVIHYMEGGEDVFVVVDDPVVASVLKRPTDFKNTGAPAEALAQAANFFARTYRIGTTGASPLAFIRNVLRDPLQATIQGGFNPLNMMFSPDVFYHTLRGYGLDDATIDTVTQRLRNWAGESTLTAEMRDRGLSQGLSYRNGAEKITKKMNRAINNPDGKLGKIIEKAEAPLETWESLFRNQIAQQSFIKNYQRTGDVNSALSSAMFDASNSTTNFSHSVGLFKRATSTVPYLSSAINGTRSFWVQFNVDPVGMVTRITAGFMVPAMAITAWNLSSEERRKAYLNLPEWYRDSHLVLLDLENNVVAFPIPDELSQYYGTARRLIEYTNEVNQQGILSIMTQGAFGFLPVEVDGYFKPDGSIDWDRGTAQMLSGLMPQAVTAIYEVWRKQDLFTGQDLSSYNTLNTIINTAANLFGTGWKNVANDIGMICGASEKDLIGKSTMDTLARDLFGMGFDDATNQFMNMIGSPTKFENGKEIKATGLFAESERLRKEIETLDRKIAVAQGEEKEGYEKEKEEKISNFTKRVAGLVNNYMNLYTITGGLKEWQKGKIVSILTLGSAFSSADSESYQYQDMSNSFLNERSLAQQRYVEAGLPAGASEETILRGENSIEVQAALNKLYGAPKQAAADFTIALKNTGLKDIRNEFFDVIEQIYDEAEAKGVNPDYDLIEKIQARYLQSVDRVLVPIINQYGIDILNNNDFIDEVRRYVNGMVPSDDWKQSIRNKKKFLSKKDYPLATVDVKKWLTQRYASSMRNRGLASDTEVTKKLQEIKDDIDAGRNGAAKSKIQELFTGFQRANYYISSDDFNLLTQYNNMVK